MSHRTLRPQQRRAAWLALASVLLGGCEVNGGTAPELDRRAVVHAVLNPTGTQQVVIVEQTRPSVSAGRGPIPEEPFREPFANARVVIYGSRQDSAVATRDPNDASIYRLLSVTIADGSPGSAPPNVLRLRPGERYRLRVETPLGVVRGETTIPVVSGFDATRTIFNVDRDTLRLTGVPVQSAAGYFLRHESKTAGVREDFMTVLDDALVFPLAQVTGASEPPWAFSFAREAIWPGLSQTFTVTAVDSNYFRYYVAGFDPFGDDTRGNSLVGGVGLFGAVAPLMSRTMDLVADVDTPIEGTWSADRISTTLPSTLTLYASPFFPIVSATGRAFPSGRARLFSGRALEAIGFMNGSAVSFTFFDPSGVADAVSASGTLENGTLVLTQLGSGERVTFRKP